MRNFFELIYHHRHCKKCNKPYVINSTDIYPTTLCHICGFDYVLDAVVEKGVRESKNKA